MQLGYIWVVVPVEHVPLHERHVANHRRVFLLKGIHQLVELSLVQLILAHELRQSDLRQTTL